MKDIDIKNVKLTSYAKTSGWAATVGPEILDEPTSALTFDEVQSLFKVIQELKQKNIGIIYITHRLAEVFEISTSIGILRDGVLNKKHFYILCLLGS